MKTNILQQLGQVYCDDYTLTNPTSGKHNNMQSEALICCTVLVLRTQGGYDVLMNGLNVEFEVTGAAAAWLRSYLTGRHQSDASLPHRSVLGPLLFAACVSPFTHGSTKKLGKIHMNKVMCIIYTPWNERTIDVTLIHGDVTLRVCGTYD